MNFDCYNVLYTKHKTQKAKRWNDGTAKICKSNGKVLFIIFLFSHLGLLISFLLPYPFYYFVLAIN